MRPSWKYFLILVTHQKGHLMCKMNKFTFKEAQYLYLNKRILVQVSRKDLLSLFLQFAGSANIAISM